MPDIEAALAEIEHSFDELRADGIGLHTTGAFTQFPDIRWVVPHSGAALAVLADRVDRICPAMAG